MPTTVKKHPEVREGMTKYAGLTLTFDQINTPGCYVFIDNGLLFRIPPEAIAQGMSPILEVVSKEPWFFFKISDDPYVPLSKARMLAADFDLTVNF